VGRSASYCEQSAAKAEAKVGAGATMPDVDICHENSAWINMQTDFFPKLRSSVRECWLYGYEYRHR